ncbi:MAG TPA: hypothetical protein VF928_05585 [Usitatibacteraceae bacterium]
MIDLVLLLLGVVLGAARLDVALQLLGPVYFGYSHDPYVAVVGWALVCSLILMWRSRAARKLVTQNTYEEVGMSATQVNLVTASLLISIIVFLLVIHSILYFIAGKLF